jgi:virulence-associated protein VapD
MLINNPTREQQISYYQIILSLYLVNPVNDVLWDDKQERFLFQIPNENDAEDALKTSILTHPISSLNNPNEYLQAFSYLHEQGINPLQGSKAYSLAKMHLYSAIEDYRSISKNKTVQVTIKEQVQSIPLDLSICKLNNNLQDNQGVLYLSQEGIKGLILNVAEMNDVLSQLTVFVEEIEKEITVLIQGITDLWSDIIYTIKKLFGNH